MCGLHLLLFAFVKYALIGSRGVLVCSRYAGKREYVVAQSKKHENL
jgi:hypothetical protein